MPAVVVMDLIENARVRETDGIPIEVVRVALISGLQGGITSIPEALYNQGPALPLPGSVHPSLRFSNLFLRERQLVAREGTIVQLEMYYRRRDVHETPPGFNSVISGGTSLEQIETEKDRDGNQITVEHQGRKQGGRIHPLMPRRELHFERVETSQTPGSITDAYVGKVNLGVYQGGAEGTWLCTDIKFTLADITQPIPTWNFRYDFRHKGEGHDPDVWYVEADTGEPGVDLIEFVGKKKIPWYLTANFAALNL